MFQNAVFGKDVYSDKFFNKHFYLFKYDGDIRNIILRYKFRENPYLYRTLSIFFQKYQKKYLNLDFYDIIIPVPISKKRMKLRGYNQSLLIAREISKILNLKLQDKNLIKLKNNVTQSSLDKKQREENVRNVYKLNKTTEEINKNILLVDDIYTTGATVNECSRILKSGGAKKVDVFTIAKD